MIIDEEILLKIKQKDNATYLMLYNEYNKLIFHVIGGLVNNQQDCSDLVQEAFAKMVKNIDSYDLSKVILKLGLLF